MKRVELKIFDSGKKYDICVDRFSLYYPVPKNRREKFGYKGSYLGFSYTDDMVIKCCHSELKLEEKEYYLGKRVGRGIFPSHVQEWIVKMEDAYNKALKTDTQEGWNEFSKIS